MVGGENGPNGPPSPTLEILPRILGGDTQVFLDWLNRTDPKNLYPFVHVLPTGLIFVGALKVLDYPLRIVLADIF